MFVIRSVRSKRILYERKLCNMDIFLNRSRKELSLVKSLLLHQKRQHLTEKHLNVLL